jgi:hypothetical protein
VQGSPDRLDAPRERGQTADRFIAAEAGWSLPRIELG